MPSNFYTMEWGMSLINMKLGLVMWLRSPITNCVFQTLHVSQWLHITHLTLSRIELYHQRRLGLLLRKTRCHFYQFWERTKVPGNCILSHLISAANVKKYIWRTRKVILFMTLYIHSICRVCLEAGGGAYRSLWRLIQICSPFATRSHNKNNNKTKQKKRVQKKTMNQFYLRFFFHTSKSTHGTHFSIAFTCSLNKPFPDIPPKTDIPEAGRRRSLESEEGRVTHEDGV